MKQLRFIIDLNSHTINSQAGDTDNLLSEIRQPVNCALVTSVLTLKRKNIGVIVLIIFLFSLCTFCSNESA